MEGVPCATLSLGACLVTKNIYDVPGASQGHVCRYSWMMEG